MDVLDVGSGTGLLALDAAHRVAASGSVVALDVSADALREPTHSGTNIRLVVGDAVSVPLADECVDAVVSRSVLIYVIDKTLAAAEFRRVLRPGGRVSVFEPINRRYQFFADVDLAELEPQRGRVLIRWLGQGDAGGALMGFDERDLERAFVDAGFDSVDLTYEVVRRRTRPTRRDVWRFLTTRPNPNMVSYEEAAREELREEADEHLADLATALTTRSSTSTSADV